jgi:peptide chain release factor 3
LDGGRRERSLSVSSAVMSLEHEGLAFNLLGRPGHREFSEHAYPTLTAADSAVIVLDAAPMALRGHRGADL